MSKWWLLAFWLFINVLQNIAIGIFDIIFSDIETFWKSTLYILLFLKTNFFQWSASFDLEVLLWKWEGESDDLDLYSISKSWEWN